MREPKAPNRRRSHAEHRLRKEAAAAFERTPSPEQKVIQDLQGRALRSIQKASPEGKIGDTVANDFIQALAHKLAEINPR